MNQSARLMASCFCGAVEIEMHGDPVAMGYCHCSDCRHWSAGPLNAFSLWPAANVRIVTGEGNIEPYNKTDNSYRKWCAKCGGYLMTDHPGMQKIDVYAAVLPQLDFQPALHAFYAEKMVSVKYGLPKMKNMPAEFGGSGETMSE